MNEVLEELLLATIALMLLMHNSSLGIAIQPKEVIMGLITDLVLIHTSMVVALLKLSHSKEQANSLRLLKILMDKGTPCIKIKSGETKGLQ